MTSETGRTHGGWYAGWNIVAVCILAQVASNGLSVNAFSLFLKSWSADLHTPISSLQLAPAAMGLVSSILAAFIGGWADKAPARRLFAIGLVALALFHIAVGFVTAPWQIIALYGTLVPIGVLLAGALTANAVVSRWFVRRLGLALGLSAFGIGIAGVVLPPLVAALSPAIGWRMIWKLAGLIVGLGVLPLAVLVLRDRPTEKDGMHYLVGGDGRRHGHGIGGPSDVGWREVFSRRNFWLLVAVYLPILAIYGGGAQNMAPIAASHGLNAKTAGLFLSALGFTHVIATLVLGLASDRFGNRVPFAALAVTAAAGALLLGFGQSFITMLLGAILIGAGGGLFPLLAAGIAAEFGSDGFGRAFGLAMSFVPVISLSPFAIAKSQEATGSYATALVGLAALALIGGGLCLMLRERRGHSAPDERALALEEGSLL